MKQKSVVVIGGGIVGLAIARYITQQFPYIFVTVLEKEAAIASHQTGHNSGVIHSGVYYKPGTLKAQLCRTGAAAMLDFCRNYGIPHQVCGKVIVATEENELPALHELQRRGIANAIPGLRMIDRDELRQLEPHCAGIRALHVPGVAVTDYAAVARKFSEQFVAKGGSVRTATAVMGLRAGVSETIIETRFGEIRADCVINCAGLHSDVIARQSGATIGPQDIRIFPFRGEYYELSSKSLHLVRGLIYPVPDSRFPFLGVHFTRRVSGGTEAGPNAVLALKREGYKRSSIHLGDVAGMLVFPGFWRMATRYWRVGLREQYRSWSKGAFTRALQRLVPEISEQDLKTGGTGVRAQAVDRRGTLLDDFCFDAAPRLIHVLNVPSPAATASLAIAKYIVEMAAKQSVSTFQWDS